MRKIAPTGKKRLIPIGLLVLAMVAVGAGAAAGTILAGRVTAVMPVAVSQALLVHSAPTNVSGTVADAVEVASPGSVPQQVIDNSGMIDYANRFVGVRSDDRTGFQSAMELAVGDWTEVKLPIKNASSNQLVGLLTLDVPAGLEVEVYTDNSTGTHSAVRIGLNTWKFLVDGGANNGATVTDGWLHIVISVDDDAPPGYYDISGTIKQIAY